MAQQSYKEALVDLRRLVAQFPATAQASQALARSRLTTSTPGCVCNHVATVSLSRSGRRSTTRRDSRSHRMVP